MAERQTNKAQAAGRERVLGMMRKYAVNSLSYLALEPDKTWFFSKNTEGVAAYAMSGRDMIICGDPICAKADLPAFLKELKNFARHRNCHIVFLFVIGENLEIYERAGMGYYKSGEEACFDLAQYDMSGGRAAKVRASFHQAHTDGITVHEYCPLSMRNPGIEKQFAEITDAWMNEKHTSRLKFALGSVGFDYPNDKRYFYALDTQGVIQGFMVFLPYRQKQGYMVDVMRRRPACTHGVMEVIFHDAVWQMKAEGVKYASFGIAPLANTTVGSRNTVFEKIENYNFQHMNFIYGFRPLYVAKAKYAPTSWEPVYFICCPKHITLSMGYAAVSVLDTNGFSDYVDAFTRYHRNGSR